MAKSDVTLWKFDKNHLKFAGLYQVNLEIEDPSIGARVSIFPGSGATEELAKDLAAWRALQHLYIHGGFADDDESEAAKARRGPE